MAGRYYIVSLNMIDNNFERWLVEKKKGLNNRSGTFFGCTWRNVSIPSYILSLSCNLVTNFIKTFVVWSKIVSRYYWIASLLLFRASGKILLFHVLGDICSLLLLPLIDNNKNKIMSTGSWLMTVRVINIISTALIIGFEMWFLVDLFISDQPAITIIIRLFVPIFIVYPLYD
jgi:hypothetical protein